jgi:Zn finger protein HypA/HybF involved in hydrogenase expression
MARFRCRACGEEGTFVYDGRHECPRCGSVDVQFALSIEQLADDDSLILALTKLAKDEPPEAEE